MLFSYLNASSKTLTLSCSPRPFLTSARCKEACPLSKEASPKKALAKHTDNAAASFFFPLHTATKHSYNPLTLARSFPDVSAYCPLHPPRCNCAGAMFACSPTQEHHFLFPACSSSRQLIYHQRIKQAKRLQVHAARSMHRCM